LMSLCWALNRTSAVSPVILRGWRAEALVIELASGMGVVKFL